MPQILEGKFALAAGAGQGIGQGHALGKPLMGQVIGVRAPGLAIGE